MKINKNAAIATGTAAALALVLAALPSPPMQAQDQTQDQQASVALAEKLAKLQDSLQAEQEKIQAAQDRARRVYEGAMAPQAAALERLQDMRLPEIAEMAELAGDEGPSWLGVETHEVSADTVKQLRLPAERGVVISAVSPDSPAAKAGLKENDVVTDVDGQRVEGAAQFRRMIREIPAGRAVQLTVWRDGRAQTLSATLGKAEEGPRAFSYALPSGAFNIQIPEIPDIPQMDLSGPMTLWPGGRARLGIDAEDVNGQLGNYFGAPDGEGVLVRGVTSGTPAEKAGLKAGDVITSFNGERVRSVGDLRQKIAANTQGIAVKLGVLRNKSQLTLTVELPVLSPKRVHTFVHSTNI